MNRSELRPTNTIATAAVSEISPVTQPMVPTLASPASRSSDGVQKLIAFSPQLTAKFIAPNAEIIGSRSTSRKSCPPLPTTNCVSYQAYFSAAATS